MASKPSDMGGRAGDPGGPRELGRGEGPGPRLFKGHDPSRYASLKGRIADGTYDVPPNLVAAAVLSRLGIH